jgi:hypothetical protein
VGRWPALATGRPGATAAGPGTEDPGAVGDAPASGPVPGPQYAPTPGPYASEPWSPFPPPGGPEHDDHDGGGGGRWIAVAAVVVCLVLVGVGSAWLLTGGARTDEASESPTFGAPLSSSPGEGDAVEPGSSASSSAPEPTAPSAPLQPTSVTATCQAADGVDSAGNVTTYAPEHTVDGRLDTAWRCDGSAVGAQLVLVFDRPVTVTAVGLVPGYAKVDPADGVDRFAQNRTVTSANWRFDSGEVHVQEIPDPQPVMTTTDLTSPVTTTRVVLEIADTGNDAAERPFTAVSDVQVSGY